MQPALDERTACKDLGRQLHGVEMVDRYPIGTACTGPVDPASSSSTSGWRLAGCPFPLDHAVPSTSFGPIVAPMLTLSPLNVRQAHPTRRSKLVRLRRAAVWAVRTEASTLIQMPIPRSRSSPWESACTNLASALSGSKGLANRSPSSHSLMALSGSTRRFDLWPGLPATFGQCAFTQSMLCASGAEVSFHPWLRTAGHYQRSSRSQSERIQIVVR
jgi:hypothetical protein